MRRFADLLVNSTHPSIVATDDTRPHLVTVLPHDTDGTPQGQCEHCLTWGELAALLDLLPHAYGCPGSPTEAEEE